MASQLATSMFNSLKGRAVQGRVYQGKEPPQFVAIFQPMVVLKGGLSSGYKSYIAGKGLTDQTYRPDATALIEISGTSAHNNNKALQVEAVATSMNSYSCFVLQSGSAVFTWYGNESTVEQQQLAAKVVECLKSRVPVKFVKEGKESLAFWLPLGGKKGYTSKKLTQEIVKEPHMFAVSLNKGELEIEEIYNYDQDDLLPEDVIILDTHAEVFVWVGQGVDSKEKQNAFEIGQKYIELAASLEGLSPYVPLYRVPEGSEPCFFTTYFSWDPAKATVSENSFKKKAMRLFGAGSMQNQEKSQGTKSGGATQRASAMAALTNAFRSSTTVTKSTPTSPRAPSRGSQRAAAIAALSNVLTAEKKSQPDSPTRRQHKKFASSEPGSPAAHHKRFPSSEPGSPAAAAAPSKGFFDNKEASPQVITEPIPETNEEDSSTKQTTEEHSSTNQTTEEDSSTKETTHDHEEGGGVDHQTFYSYEQLNTKSKNPITGIDYKNRETYLSPEEFEAVFKMTKEAFYKLPRWKQDQVKKKLDLF